MINTQRYTADQRWNLRTAASKVDNLDMAVNEAHQISRYIPNGLASRAEYQRASHRCAIYATAAREDFAALQAMYDTDDAG